MDRKPVSDRYYGEPRRASARPTRSTSPEPQRPRRDGKRVLLDENQASKLLQISPRTLQSWRFRGGGPKFVRMGRRVRYRLVDLDEFVEQSIRRSTSDPGPKSS